MSKSTPDDLAVAFHSVVRRRKEAIDSAEDAPIAGLLADLDGHIAAAATLVGSAPDPNAVADAIAGKPTDEWDVGTLDELRRLATEIGTTLRRIADSGPPRNDP